MILLLKYNHFLWKGCESHGLIFALHRITEWNWRPMALSGSFLWIKPSCMLFCCCSSITAKAENEKAFRLVLCVLKCYQIILSFNMPTKTKKMSFFEIQAFRNIILRNLKSFGESMEILFEKILWNYDDFFLKWKTIMPIMKKAPIEV